MEPSCSVRYDADMRKGLILWTLLVATILTIGFFGSKRLLTASIANNDDNKDQVDQVFDVPIPVVWTGDIFATLQGGQGYGLRKDDGEMFMAFYNDNKFDPDLIGQVTIEGKWQGIDCAYKNTVFKNKCVPSVEIDKITLTHH